MLFQKMAAKTPVRLVAVDDDPLVLDFIESALGQPDLEIYRSSDPAEGWELIRRYHPDIVILVLVMPKISGMDLLEWIMELDSGMDVLSLSSDDSRENAFETSRQ